MNKAKSDLTIYSINGNEPQIVTLNIAGEYYKIEFSLDNVSDAGWSATVTDMNNESLSTVCHSWCPVSSFLDLNRNQNLWFKDKTKQYEVYLVNPSLSSTLNKTQEEIDAVKKNLEGYTIWVSKGDIQTQIKAVEDAIQNAIQAEGFD